MSRFYLVQKVLITYIHTVSKPRRLQYILLMTPEEKHLAFLFLSLFLNTESISVVKPTDDLL